MPLRRGEWEQFADFSGPVVEVEKPVEVKEEKPKRGPGRPKKVEEIPETVEVDEGTTAEE